MSAPDRATTDRTTAGRAFLGLLQRDVWNTLRHDLPGFLAQALLQPLALLFVFGLVLPKIGAAGPEYGAQLPPWGAALEKVVFAAGRAIVAAVLILPLGQLILPGDLPAQGANWVLFVVLLVVGGLAGSAIGLVLGTLVPPNQINVIFAVALTPLIFTGATFYP